MSPFCWHCGKPFPSRASMDNAKFVSDQIGHQHQVHQVCFAAAMLSVQTVTAGAPTASIADAVEYGDSGCFVKRIGPDQ